MPFCTNGLQGDRLARVALSRTLVSMAVLLVVRVTTTIVPQRDVVSDHPHVARLRGSKGHLVRLALRPIPIFCAAHNQHATNEQDLPPRAYQLLRILPPRELVSQRALLLIMHNLEKQVPQHPKPPRVAIQRDFPSYHANLSMEALALYTRPTLLTTPPYH